MATSGTIGQTIFTNQQIIDHAFRRCKMVEQEITSEHIDTALDLLWLFCMSLSNKGIKLWNVQPIILPIYERESTVPLPVGTEDILDINLRTQTRITNGTATATEGVADNAFDSDLSTACTQVSAAGNITLDLSGDEGATPINTYGILPNVSGSWDFEIEASNDNFTTEILTIVSRTAQTVTAGEWLWFDVQGINANAQYRLRATGTTVLDVIELVFQNTPQEIPFYWSLNRTDYSNLPDKVSTGRPTQLWFDRQRTQPELEIWPNPEFQFTFAQITGYVHTQIQDVGTMRDELEVPDRWYLAIVTNLAAHLGREIKEVREELVPRLDADAAYYLSDAWDGEGDGSDTFWRPNISPYTR